MTNATPFQLFYRAVQARTYPRIAWMYRHKTWIFQETLMPILSVSALAFVYQWMQAPREYVGMVILGAAMTAFWMNVLWSMGGQLYWERDSGNLELYIMSPAPMMSILTGMALGGMLMTLVRAVTIVTAGMILFEVTFAPSSWWLLLLVFALTMTALYGLGAMFSSLFLLWGREAWHTVNLLQEPVFLATGMNFPLAALGKVLHWVIPGMALLLPLTAGMDAMRQVLFWQQQPAFEGFLPLWWEIGLLAVLSAVFLSFARRTLAMMERRAKEQGTITTRWK
jgi:ABC-2 type transport system permease protein